jgi:hypothetical protein
MTQAGSLPRYPVVVNPNEKNPMKIQLKPKMKVNETGDVADISMVPDDLDGNFDYIADVKSLAAGSEQEQMNGQQAMINTLLTGPSAVNVIQMLQGEGYKLKVKEMLSDSFENLGANDPERYFEKIQQSAIMGNGQTPGQPGQPVIDPTQAGAPQMGGIQSPQPGPGLPQLPQAHPIAGPSQQMAGPVTG